MSLFNPTSGYSVRLKRIVIENEYVEDDNWIYQCNQQSTYCLGYNINQYVYISLNNSASFDYCEQKKEDHYMIQSVHKWQKCLSKCEWCYDNNNSYACYWCRPHYFINNTKCAKCERGCIICNDESIYGCVNCSKYYTLKQGHCDIKTDVIYAPSISLAIVVIVTLVTLGVKGKLQCCKNREKVRKQSRRVNNNPNAELINQREAYSGDNQDD